MCFCLCLILVSLPWQQDVEQFFTINFSDNLFNATRRLCTHVAEARKHGGVVKEKEMKVKSSAKIAGAGTSKVKV